jgi:hypothetical protein
MDQIVRTGEVGATLYRTGATSIAVTVPLSWARARGLKPGDKVRLRLGRYLTLIPGGSLDPGPEVTGATPR